MKVTNYKGNPIKVAWSALVAAVKVFFKECLRIFKYQYNEDHNVVLIGYKSYSKEPSGIVMTQTRFWVLVTLFTICFFSFCFALSTLIDLGSAPVVETKVIVDTVVVNNTKTDTVVKTIKVNKIVKVNTSNGVDGLLGEASKAKGKGAPVGNDMSNLAPILNPNYIKKHNIPKAVVDEKMQIVNDYVKTYAASAVQEMNLYGIPASITLAQGLLESNAGASLLARKANNHFGIKCFSKTCKKGHCMNASDDTHKDFFRMYPSGKDCYRAHSEFLQSDRYKDLKKLGKKDYKGWAKGLKKAGYATAPHYAEALISIVETLKLYKYDK